MLLRHNLHAFSRQSACFFRQPFHAFVDEGKRDTPVSSSFFSKMSEIRPFFIHFFQKQTRYTCFSIIFHQNERNTPVSHLFFQKRARYPRISCFFCKTRQLVSFAFGIASWHNKPVKRPVCRPAMAAKEGKGMAKACKKCGLFV